MEKPRNKGRMEALSRGDRSIPLISSAPSPTKRNSFGIERNKKERERKRKSRVPRWKSIDQKKGFSQKRRPPLEGDASSGRRISGG